MQPLEPAKGLSGMLEAAWRAWQDAPRPFDNFRAQRVTPTYAVECDLDHQADYVSVLVEKCAIRDPHWDFRMRVDCELEDLESFEAAVRAADTSDDTRSSLLRYIAVTRRLLEAVRRDAADVPGSATARWPIAALILLAAALLALGFTSLLARYWTFYHLGTAGTGLGLLYIVLPGSFLLAALCGCLVAWRLMRRDVSRGGAALAAAGSAAILLVSLFAFEVWRTTALRSSEGDGAGDLAPFFASLIGRG